jgi:hypothetical protein
LSRRPPSSLIDGNIKYLSVDFLEKPEEIAKTLKEHVLEV